MESYIEKAMNTELPRRRKINIDPKIGFGLEIENNGFLNSKAVQDAERVICNVDKMLSVKDDRSLSIIRPNRTIEQGIEVVTPVMHNKKVLAKEVLNQIKAIVGEDDPFFITATIALDRMQ